MLKKLSILLLLCFGCESEYFSRIPNSTVVWECDINLTDIKLNPIYGYQTYTSTSIVGRALGYGGLLVFHGNDAFYAYDLACPYEVSRTVRVSVFNTLQAKCEKCQSVFSIYDGTGAPVSGPAQKEGYYLRRYTVSQSSNILHIYN